MRSALRSPETGGSLQNHGYTLGGAVGLAGIENKNGVTADWIKSGGFTVRTPAGPVEVQLSLTPLLDQKR